MSQENKNKYEEEEELKPLGFGNDEELKPLDFEEEEELEPFDFDDEELRPLDFEEEEELKPLDFSDEEEELKPLDFENEEELKPLDFGQENSFGNRNNYIHETYDDDFVKIAGENNARDIKNKDSNFVFFFGTAGSGKSVILSTMLYALRTKFGVIRPKIGTPNSREAMALLSKFFENIRQGILPERTVRDQVLRLDMVFEPNNRSQKVKPINLTFLETSGENHNEIRGGRDYHKSISQYLKAEIPINFVIVTSYQSAHKEDSLINEFLYYIENKGRNLKNVNVVLVISKWDCSGSSDRPSAEELNYFIKERLPMTYQFLETNEMSKTYYTVGSIEEKNGEDRIVNLNLDSAYILSKWLYKSISGIDIDYEGTLWEQLKWSIGIK